MMPYINGYWEAGYYIFPDCKSGFIISMLGSQIIVLQAWKDLEFWD